MFVVVEAVLREGIFMLVERELWDVLVGIVVVNDVIKLAVKKECLSVVLFSCIGCDCGTMYGNDGDGYPVELLVSDDSS